MLCLSPRCWYFREHLVRSLGPALSQLDAGTAEAGVPWLVSIAHETPCLPLLGCCRGGKPGHGSHLWHGFLWSKFNSNQICWWHPNQSGSKQSRQTQTANDPERSEQWEHYRQEEKLISSKCRALPRERKCSSHHFSLTEHSSLRGKTVEKTPKCYQAIPSEHVGTMAPGLGWIFVDVFKPVQRGRNAQLKTYMNTSLDIQILP